MEQPFLYVVLHPPTTVVTATSSDHKAHFQSPLNCNLFTHNITESTSLQFVVDNIKLHTLCCELQSWFHLLFG